MITSRLNRRLKTIRRLRRSKGRSHAHLLLEGPHLLRAAIAAELPLLEVFATTAFLERAEHRRLIESLPEPPIEVADDVLDELADADTPRGLVAVAVAPWSRADHRSGTAGSPHREPPGARGAAPRACIYLYLDGVQDPGNLGALARVAEASGVEALLLSPGCAYPGHPRALRASAGSLLRLPTLPGMEPAAVDDRLREEAPCWVVLEPVGGEDLYRTQLDPPLILALGAEGPGVSDPLRRRADRRLSIPTAGGVESLNVAVAAALVLFEIRRRRRWDTLAAAGE